MPESPFSAAILKAEITKPNFNGQITYTMPPDFQPPAGLTFPPEQSQVFGDEANVAPGVDVSVYSSGFRNPFDLVYTTTGLLYATNNAANTGFGDVSTSATTQEPFTQYAADGLYLLSDGGYHGHPNRNRGRTDDRQNVYYNPDSPDVPGVYTGPLASTLASTNGVIEYRATTFGGQLRGNLLAQQWNGQLYSFTLSPDGQQVQKTESFTNIADGLDVLTGPGGAIIGIDLSDNSITVATPNDPVTGATVYDIFPWRAPAFGGQTFIIGGANFDPVSTTTVTIGGQQATLTSVTSKQIQGIFPSLSPTGGDLLDIVVQNAGQTSTLTDAFLPV